MNQRPVDSHPAPETLFCSTDDQLRFFFVEVTAATLDVSAARAWLISNLERFLPDEYDAELDVPLLECVGREWWTHDSQPADGPGTGVRPLWRFDVGQALSLTRVIDLAIDDEPGLPRDAVAALERRARAGLIGDDEWARLQVLLEREASLRSAYAARRDAAPLGAPRVRLRDDELFTAMALMKHAAELLLRGLPDATAGDLLRLGLSAVEERMAEETADAIEEHVADLDWLPGVGDPPSSSTGPDASDP